LLVGDIVYIETGIYQINSQYLGEILPVDGVVFKSSNLSVDESSITGESDQVKKSVP